MKTAYLDANAIIRFVEADDELLDFLLGLVRSGSLRLCTSEFTLAEVLVMPVRGQDAELIAVYDTLLSAGGEIDIVPVDRAVLRRSADLRAELGNRTPDAIHIATAALCNCTIFVSSDLRIRLSGSMTRIDAEAVQQIDIPG